MVKFSNKRERQAELCGIQMECYCIITGERERDLPFHKRLQQNVIDAINYGFPYCRTIDFQQHIDSYITKFPEEEKENGSKPQGKMD